MEPLPWGKFFMTMTCILAFDAVLFLLWEWFSRQREIRRAGEHLAASPFTWPVQQELLRGPRSISSIAASLATKLATGPANVPHVVLGVSYALRAMEVRGEVVRNPLNEIYSLSRGRTR